MSSEISSAASVPGLREKVAFLRRPSSYPEETRDVEAVETHMAWVFLTDRHAYKLKKPVRYEFLDFSTPEARREDCRAEVRLNRRLAPDVYLGVTALRVADGAELRLGGEGRVVDWLTRMKRLPEDRFLDRAIEAGAVDADRLRAAAVRLARFYDRAGRISLSAAAYLDRFRDYVAENHRELTRSDFPLPRRLADRIGRAQEDFLSARSGLLEARVRENRIVEGHGDLRPEHVCLVPEPVFIDCIEFSREFRTLDPADELSFLAVECERLGAEWVGEVFLDEYRSATGDRPAGELLDFYRSYRAYLRAKLSIWHLRDDHVTEASPWAERAGTYLELAERHLPK